MALAPLPEVTVTPVTHLPEKYFLENLVVRADGSVLITALLSKELWLVPAPARELGEPVLLHRFDHLTTGIVEVEPDVFVVSLSELYTTHESHLVRIDLNGWTSGTPVNPEIIYTFDERVRALNGSCAFGPSSMQKSSALSIAAMNSGGPVGSSVFGSTRTRMNTFCAVDV